MRRLPSPWVAIPVLLAAVAGGLVGYFVTDASCAPGSCVAAATVVGVLVALGTGVGVGVVVVLAIRSLAEWRDHAERDVLIEVEPEDPGPPTC